jgi:hypothetical protein
VKIEYDELPGVFTIEESESAVENNDADRVIWEGSEFGGTANCFKSYLMYSGDAAATEDGLAAAFETADSIVEGEYHTGAQEQLYIENNGVIAECNKDALGSARQRHRRVRSGLDAMPVLPRPRAHAGLQSARRQVSGDPG